jgi:hypothetical protein
MRLRQTRLLLVIVLLVLAVSILPRAVFADTDSTGGTTSSAAPGSGYVFGFPISISGSGTVQSVGVNWAGTQSGNVRVALYSAGSGKPGSLLAESASTAMTTAAGWQDISVTCSVTAGSYWVAIQISGSKTVYYKSGSRSYYLKSYGAFDSSWSGSSSQDSAAQWNMRVTYTGQIPEDFSITASPTSLPNVGAGSTASFTLNLAAGGGFTDTVSLSVTSGCPSGVTCTVTPDSITSFPGSSTLSVPTLITTSGSYSVVVHAQSTSKSHDVTVTLSVTGPASYPFNVKSGATQIVVTLTYSYTGSGAPSSGNIMIAGPSGTPTLYESGAVVYDRTSIAVSGGSNSYSIIHRVTFTITAPGSAQVWTALVSLSGVSSYNVTIEVS